MKINNKKWIVRLIIPLAIVVMCIGFFLLHWRPTEDVVYVKFSVSGGLAGTHRDTIVFSDDGNYYLYESGEVYTISSRSYSDLMIKTSKLGLDKIDGYYSSTADCDAFGTRFYVGYADGTYVTGGEYSDKYPAGHDAFKLHEYLDQITDREPCDYEMKINDTHTCFTYNLLVGDIYNYYGVYEKDGDFYLFSDNGRDRREKKLSKREHQKYLKQAVEFYVKSNKFREGVITPSRIDIDSDVWLTCSGWLGDYEEETRAICEQIADELKGCPAL